MATPLRVLICDDSQDDVALTVRELRRGGYEPSIEHVDTPTAMAAALERESWDVVLSDYTMPQFSAPAALALVQERGVDVPFIIVSGSIGEDAAVEAMRAGASDYILKDRPARLPSAVERALREAELRRERRRAEEERARLLERERAARAAAEAALRARDEFLSIAAHELKTPLTSLKAVVQLTARRLEKQGSFDPSRLDRALRTVEQQTDKLARLVTQLLDISRIEAGQFAISPEPTDLARLAHGVVSLMQVTREHHHLVLDAPPALPARVDPLRFEQVLTNLLDNAIRYSPAGGQIDVRLLLLEPTSAHLEVRDHGPGIPEEDRPRLFDRFFQAHADSHASGMGLGLYISREIVEAHGGQIDAEFPPDGGTRVAVTLPTGLGDTAGADRA